MTDRRLSNQDLSNLSSQDLSNLSSQDLSNPSNQDLSNQDLLSSLTAALKQESVLLVTVITLLIKVEDRRLHLELACPSMFDFCWRRLGLSEGEAFRRITAARLAKRFPQLLDAIRARRVHLSSVVALRDLFTAENVSELLEVVAGKSKREIEELVARRAPRPDAPTLIRRLPDTRVTPKRNVALVMASQPLASSVVAPGARAVVAPGAAASAAAEQDVSRGSAPTAPLPAAPVPGAPAAAAPTPVAKWLERPHEVTPLSGSRHRVQLTVSFEVRAKLERAQSLMRHRNVDGDLAVVVERALDLLIAKLETEKLGATSRPPTRTTIKPASLPFAPDTSAPATSAPARSAPARSAPARSAPVTSAPATSAPAMSAPATSAPATSAPAMSAPTTRPAPSKPPPARRMSPNTITAATRREVVRRDDERCTFVSVTGERCPARDFLEIDHRHPRALGGGSDAGNLRILCRAHNLYAAEQRFGRAHVERAIRDRRDERHASRQRRGSSDSLVPTQTRLPCEGT